MFDENFLMAVATLGALALAIYENGEYLEVIAVMLFYQSVSGSRVTPWGAADETSAT